MEVDPHERITGRVKLQSHVIGRHTVEQRLGRRELQRNAGVFSNNCKKKKNNNNNSGCF